MNDQDTICAVSTPPGEGGIGIIRVSGKNAVRLASRIFRPKSGIVDDLGKSHRLRYGHILDPSTGELVDEALFTVMRAPASYTREDVVEINCHGGMIPLWRTMDLLISIGVRQAEPGEFTKRAFLNGRIDLVQAEAVMDIIRAKTVLAHRAANEQLVGGLSAEITMLRDRLISLIAAVEAEIDFPEDVDSADVGQLKEAVRLALDGIEEMLAGSSFGRILRDGYAAVIVGRPNVGKSSLLNALLRQDRAIVTAFPGTTRDVLEEYLNVAGVPLRILDTAGIRHSHDVAEQEGVRRSLAAIEAADIVLLVLDGSQPLAAEDRRVMDETKRRNIIAVINKSDLPRALEPIDYPTSQVSVSCRTGIGLAELRASVADLVKKGTVASREHAWVVNRRHQTALEEARKNLQNVLRTIETGLSAEFVAVDLRSALDSLGLIVGKTYTEDILERIFGDFCIGK